MLSGKEGRVQQVPVDQVESRHQGRAAGQLLALVQHAHDRNGRGGRQQYVVGEADPLLDESALGVVLAAQIVGGQVDRDGAAPDQADAGVVLEGGNLRSTIVISARSITT